ncbi:MAG: hypothetical protein PHF87_09655 [Desulfotomaculaceae bacterium]|nr:hypothetical protein [Desulfotomaculaceae bacterium]
MDRTWYDDDSFMKADAVDCSFADRVLSWLESDDTEFEKIFGYSICLAAVTYIITRLFI